MIIQHLITAAKADATLPTLGTPVLADRFYPGSAPDAPTYPLVVFSKVGGVGESDFAGDAGIERARVQVDVVALGYADVVTIKKALRTWMLQRPPMGPACIIDSCHCINDMDFPAAAPQPGAVTAGPTKLRRRLLEFNVWYRP